MSDVLRKPIEKISTRNKEMMMKEKEFEQVLKELRPVLLREAKKIKRPSYIDDQDLVQEALIHIYNNKNLYDDKLSSIKTWCITVANRKFYNIASTGFRGIRHPKNDIGDLVPFVEFDDIISNRFYCKNEGEENIIAKELLERVDIKLRSLAKKVLRALLENPESLIDTIKNEHKQSARLKHVGKREKLPYTFEVKSEHLATYFGVKYHAIVKAKDEIQHAVKMAMRETI